MVRAARSIHRLCDSMTLRWAKYFHSTAWVLMAQPVQASTSHPDTLWVRWVKDHGECPACLKHHMPTPNHHALLWQVLSGANMINKYTTVK